MWLFFSENSTTYPCSKEPPLQTRLQRLRRRSLQLVRLGCTPLIQPVHKHLLTIGQMNYIQIKIWKKQQSFTTYPILKCFQPRALLSRTNSIPSPTVFRYRHFFVACNDSTRANTGSSYRFLRCLRAKLNQTSEYLIRNTATEIDANQYKFSTKS